MTRVFRPPLTARVLSLFGVAVLGAVSALFIVVAVIIVRAQWPFALMVAALAWFLAGLAGYCARDLHGKWGLRVALGAHAAALDLPANRSLINKTSDQHLTVPYTDIEGIETRLEAYPSLGMLSMQRAYVLRRKSGAPVFLFEDRALGTAMASSWFEATAAELAARAGVKVRDLGMVEGSGGILGVWHTHAVDWSAPAVSREVAYRLWRHAAITGTLAVGVTIFAVVLRLMIALA